MMVRHYEIVYDGATLRNRLRWCDSTKSFKMARHYEIVYDGATVRNRL
jgi:hypothetical protein